MMPDWIHITSSFASMLTILEQRYCKRPDRLLLYWTSEAKKEDALWSFPQARSGRGAGSHFDGVVRKDPRQRLLPQEPTQNI
jgi:hypothetical protein